MNKITFNHKYPDGKIKGITGYYYEAKNGIFCVIWKNWFGGNKWYVNELETGEFFGIVDNTIKGARKKVEDLQGEELDFWKGKFSIWEKLNILPIKGAQV